MVYNPIMDKLELDQMLNLRIDQTTFDMFREQSVDDMRSMSAQVRYLIRKEWDQRQTTDKPQQPYAAE